MTQSMTKANAKKLLKLLGVADHNISMGNWVSSPCPLAPWTHSGGTDSNPSFAIDCTGDDRYNCYSCGGGDMYSLVQKLSEYGAKAPKYQLRAVLELLAGMETDDLVLDIKDFGSTDHVYDSPVPESVLGGYVSAFEIPRAMKYLRSRGLSDRTIKYMDVRYDYGKDTVCFPTRNFNGELMGLRGRFIDPVEHSYHVYKFGDAGYRKCWLGEHTVDLSQPVLMVESVFDYASCYEVYDNVVAPLSVGISKEYAHRMRNAFDIVTLFDQGKGGDRARALVTKYWTDSIICHVHIPPTEDGKLLDPGDLNPEELENLLDGYLPFGKKCV